VTPAVGHHDDRTVTVDPEQGAVTLAQDRGRFHAAWIVDQGFGWFGQSPACQTPLESPPFMRRSWAAPSVSTRESQVSQNFTTQILAGKLIHTIQ